MKKKGKNIVVCCDGTWKRADDKHPSNVFKMYERVDQRTAAGQVAYHDDGVGAKRNIFDKFFGGAFGLGLSKNIREAYEFVVDNYQPGDRLYLLGFSRGAFTVRSLAGMIRNCGVLQDNDRDLIKRAFKLYRSQKPEDHPNGVDAITFRKEHCHAAPSDNDHPRVPDIQFIGVFDTVGALGNPLWTNAPSSFRTKFHDTSLSSIVKTGCHAVAVDEHRWNFRACLWDQPLSKAKRQNLYQVWFPGAHSNVGGGYPDSSLSDLTLAWMMKKAQRFGLTFTESIPTPDWDAFMGTLPEDSWEGTIYDIMPRYFRPVRLGKTTRDMIHPCTRAKFKKGAAYRPKNLVPPLG